MVGKAPNPAVIPRCDYPRQRQQGLILLVPVDHVHDEVDDLRVGEDFFPVVTSLGSLDCLVLVLQISTDLKFVVELLVFHVCIISACGGSVNNFLGKLVLSVIILIAEEADACPIVSLDSLDKRSQTRNGNMTRNIVGQAHEIAIAIHDGNLHGGGILEGSIMFTIRRATIPHIVVLAVVVRANTDGESVATQILDLEATRFVQAGHSGFRVVHAYSISYFGSGVYSEDGFIFIYK